MGLAAIYRGRAAWTAELGLADADLTLVGSTKWQDLSPQVADLDGDLCDDLVTASWAHPTSSRTPSGEVFVFHGGP